jgi:hypothetical protein
MLKNAIAQHCTKKQLEKFLKEFETDSITKDLNAFFDRMVDVERIKVGKRQTIDTLISEELYCLQSI